MDWSFKIHLRWVRLELGDEILEHRNELRLDSKWAQTGGRVGAEERVESEQNQSAKSKRM